MIRNQNHPVLGLSIFALLVTSATVATTSRGLQRFRQVAVNLGQSALYSGTKGVWPGSNLRPSGRPSVRRPAQSEQRNVGEGAVSSHSGSLPKRPVESEVFLELPICAASK